MIGSKSGELARLEVGEVGGARSSILNGWFDELSQNSKGPLDLLL